MEQPLCSGPAGMAVMAPFLQAAQAARVFPDSKTLVDMPLAAPPAQVAAAFQALQLPDPASQQREQREALLSFCQQWLLPVESDLCAAQVPGLAAGPPPGWLPLVTSPEIRSWAEHLFDMWGFLARQVAPGVRQHPDRHTLMAVEQPFVIPGARFRETYYWDTYWVVRGLLACGLLQLAQGILCNMLSCVESLGFMPNGTRSYYLNRSQPPLLSQMVASVHAASPDAALLRRAVHALVREHAYWTSGAKQVMIQAADGQGHRLSRYWADWDQPRPESQREDQATAQGLSEEAARQLWRELASAAESGWDFSSRWLQGSGSGSEVSGGDDGGSGSGGNSSTGVGGALTEVAADLAACRTTRVVPADLNALLYQMERNISSFAAELGDAELAAGFAQHAQQRLAAIQALLWDEGSGQWRDLVLLDLDEELEGGGRGSAQQQQQAQRQQQNQQQQNQQQQNQQQQSQQQQGQQQQGQQQQSQAESGAAPQAVCISRQFRHSGVVAASNWVPLYCGCTAAGGSPQAAAAVASLSQSGLIQSAGVAVSRCGSGEQWDWPNSWPPLTCMLLEGCREWGGEAGAQLAAALAQQYLHTAHTAWRHSGRMFEKFDALRCGAPGGGGEYECVDGFGWTNGVALLLLERYGWQPEALKALLEAKT